MSAGPLMKTLRASFLLAAFALALPLLAGSFERFPLPHTIAVPATDVEAADTYAWAISSDRPFVAKVGTDGHIDTFPVKTSGPQHIVLDPTDGSVWYANYFFLGHLSVTGELLAEYQLPFLGYSYISDLIFGPDDHLWFGRPQELLRVSRAGDVTVFSLPGNFDLSYGGLAAGPDGNVWVTGHYANAIGRMTPSGTFTTFSNGAVDSDYPNGITAAPDGNLWFTSNYGKLKKVTTAGDITEVQPYASARGAIAAGMDGRLWWLDWALSISKYNIGTNTIESTYPLSSENTFARALSAGSSGVWWGSEGKKIGRITYAGEVQEHDFKALPPEPTAMASSAENLWFVAASENQIGRTDTLGGTVLFDLPHPDSRPMDIVAGPDAMWFTEETGDRIGRIDGNGTIQEFPVLTAGGKPTGIAFGPDGNIWFTLAAADKIGRITPAGVVTEFPLPGIGRYPNSIAAGTDGNLWFTCRDSKQYGRITPAGVVTEFPSVGDWSPQAIIAAPDGNVWFATNLYNHRISPSGERTQFERYNLVEEFTVGADGALWGNTRCCQSGITRTTLDGTTHYYDIPAGFGGSAIAKGPDGKIWFSDSSERALHRINPDEPITAIGKSLCLSSFGSVESSIVASFVDPDTTREASEYEARIHWGDGAFAPLASITKTSPGHFNVTGSYYNPDFTPVNVKVTFTAKPKAGTLGQTAVAFSVVHGVNASASATSFYSEGGSGTLTVTTMVSCSWIATPNANWITFPNGNSGSGNATLQYTILANNTGDDRTGTIKVGTKTITITQSGARNPQSSLYLITPCRLIDTRDTGQPIGGKITWQLTPAGHCGIPTNATAIVANITAVNPAADGWLALFRAAQPWPGVSTLNHRAGRTRANNALIPLQADAFSIYNGGESSLHFIIDVTGYFK